MIESPSIDHWLYALAGQPHQEAPALPDDVQASKGRAAVRGALDPASRQAGRLARAGTYQENAMSEDEIRAQICEFGDRVRLRASALKRETIWKGQILATDDDWERDMRQILADVERKLDAIKAEES